MARKVKLGIVFGGRTGEHSVSVTSGVAVADAADPDRYDVKLIGITRAGKWLSLDGVEEILNPDDPGKAEIKPGEGRLLAAVPGSRSFAFVDDEGNGLPGRLGLDVAFPVLHGPMGEDGTVQGMFELMDLPYVGADVLGSALGMDKDVMKRLARDAGIEIVPFLVVRNRHWATHHNATLDNVTAWCLKKGFPVFIKPANLGSSVGISKVDSVAGVSGALEVAFEHDTKVIVEKGIDAREIECAILGGLQPEASPVLGEVIPEGGGFYSYDAKYVTLDKAQTIVPAQIEESLATRIRTLAVRAFRALECWGMARVDFLVEKDTDKIFFNELNSIPGFTPISMYAKMWVAAGLAYPVLVDRLVDLALERHERKPVHS
jgi:D-alanine-D-alanine ligase